MPDETSRSPAPLDHRLPASSGTAPKVANGADPAELRREIDQTRRRMSRTLDTLEDRLAEGKEELVARATFRDLRQRITREPWRSLAIAFAAGYVVAALRD